MVENKYLDLEGTEKIINKIKSNYLDTEDGAAILEALNLINQKLDAMAVDGIVKITHSELVELQNDNKLIPGQKYQITDYALVTKPSAYFRSNGTRFDLVLEAIDENRFKEQCYAKHNPNTSTLSKDVIDKLQIWYELQPDTRHYDFLDPEKHKGCITRLIDEYNNDAPYDHISLEYAMRDVQCDGQVINHGDFLGESLVSKIVEDPMAGPYTQNFLYPWIDYVEGETEKDIAWFGTFINNNNSSSTNNKISVPNYRMLHLDESSGEQVSHYLPYIVCDSSFNVFNGCRAMIINGPDSGKFNSCSEILIEGRIGLENYELESCGTCALGSRLLDSGSALRLFNANIKLTDTHEFFANCMADIEGSFANMVLIYSTNRLIPNPKIKAYWPVWGNYDPNNPFEPCFYFRNIDRSFTNILYYLLYNDGIDDFGNNIIKSYTVAIPEELLPPYDDTLDQANGGGSSGGILLG